MTRNLYHFTRGEYLSSILKHGIDSGSVPINEKDAVRCICLTELGEPSQQIWTYSMPKADYRLTVALDESDRRLWKWRHFAKGIGMRSRFYRIVTETGNGDAYKWWIFLGVIPPTAIKAVWSRSTGEFLRQDVLAAIAKLPEKRGTDILADAWPLIPADEALTRLLGKTSSKEAA